MMAILETILLLILIVPVTFFIATVFILAALGKSLGFRRKYVEFLLYIFEYGKKRIEHAQKAKEHKNDEGFEDYTINEEDDNCNRWNEKLSKIPETRTSSVLEETKRRLSFSDLTRPPPRITRSRNASSISDFGGVICEERTDFAFSDVFEFVQTGIEAIVEDQVTQRFVAEELKSWNLLTRTNRHYEFISWRLSLIWVVGFFLRYCIMLPFRVAICFVGTSALMTFTFFIGLIPDVWAVKKKLNNHASKLSFRLLSRAFSAIVTYHQIENKPVKNGICVANHTSPIDVVLLACDTSYAMVLFLTITTGVVGVIPSRFTNIRRSLYNVACLNAFGLLSWSISALIKYHDTENRPGGWTVDVDGIPRKGGDGGGGICVANHTSPIDVCVLAVDNTYAMIGQVHGGFLGILQRALGRASSHIWFERSEMKDREAVAKRLKEHVEDTSKLPILIFPEGTCINNSAVMQFKKGSFEVGGVIYPVAIKYDSRFGDPFWNSHEYSMLQYLYMMMTSWAIVCDVWYLPPVTRLPGETSVDFANRVKAEIARKGGLVDLDWDGQLKRAPAKREWKQKEQLKYSKKFSRSPRHIVPLNGHQNDSPNPST